MRDIQINLLLTSILYFFIESWFLQFILLELSHSSFEFEINVLTRLLIASEILPYEVSCFSYKNSWRM